MESLAACGYDSFKLLDQSTVCHMTDPETGRPFSHGSSGPFGHEVPGEWHSIAISWSSIQPRCAVRRANVSLRPRTGGTSTALIQDSMTDRPEGIPKKTSPHATMLNLIIGYWVSRLIQIAAKLNLADFSRRVRARPKSWPARGCSGTAALSASSCYGERRRFPETKSGRFKLTPLAATLQTGVAGSMRTGALMLNSDWQWDAWQKLFEGIATDDFLL